MLAALPRAPASASALPLERMAFRDATGGTVDGACRSPALNVVGALDDDIVEAGADADVEQGRGDEFLIEITVARENGGRSGSARRAPSSARTPHFPTSGSVGPRARGTALFAPLD
jgi:hypothetical protein